MVTKYVTEMQLQHHITRPYYPAIEFRVIYWLRQILLMKKLCQMYFHLRQEITSVQFAQDFQNPMLWHVALKRKVYDMCPKKKKNNNNINSLWSRFYVRDLGSSSESGLQWLWMLKSINRLSLKVSGLSSITPLWQFCSFPSQTIVSII